MNLTKAPIHGKHYCLATKLKQRVAELLLTDFYNDRLNYLDPFQVPIGLVQVLPVLSCNFIYSQRFCGRAAYPLFQYDLSPWQAIIIMGLALTKI